jgi:Tfp pilus assembly protein PilF
MNPVLRRVALACTLFVLAACGDIPGRPPAEPSPADKALSAGLRAYDEAQYPAAERQLQLALQLGVHGAKDRANAHKHLAFVYCTSNRIVECETQFRAARRADPGFALSRSEIGHPLWGPVWQRIAQP